MAYAPATGNTTSVAFGTTSAYNDVEITSVSVDGISTEDMDVSHLGTTGFRDYIPGDLKEGGTITVEHLTDLDAPVLPVHVTETITFTQPITTAGNTTAGDMAFPGYVNNVSWKQVNEDAVKGTYTIKVAGDVTFTASSA